MVIDSDRNDLLRLLLTDHIVVQSCLYAVRRRDILYVKNRSVCQLAFLLLFLLTAFFQLLVLRNRRRALEYLRKIPKVKHRHMRKAGLHFRLLILVVLIGNILVRTVHVL